MTRTDDSEFKLERAKKLQRALRNKQWTRTFLADKTGYDEKTIRNVLSGAQVRDKTIIDVCQALGIEPIFDDVEELTEVADAQYGGYSRVTHRLYETFYAFYRRDTFDNDKLIYKSIFKIFWDVTERRLSFKEYYRRMSTSLPDVKAFTGPVYISPHTSLLHMLTIIEGAVRTLTLTKMRAFEGIMRGVLLTQTESLTFYQPTVSPVALRVLTEYNIEARLNDDIARLSPESNEYAFADKELLIAERQIIRLALGSNH
jgi:hypothetical protein